MRPAALIVSLALLAAGCATVTNPLTGQPEYLWIDPGVEHDLGQQVAAQVETQFTRSRNASMQSDVARLGHRLALVSDRPGVPYQFTVLRGKEVNAFAGPGGWVYVFEGAVSFARAEAELAAVLAHEIGHVAAWHHVQHLQQEMGYQLFEQLVLGRAGQPTLQQAARVGYALLDKGFSRRDEIEADRLAVRYLQRAGYDPTAMLTFLKRLAVAQQEDAHQVGVLFRTHPYIADRIAAVEDEMQRSASPLP